MTTGWWLAGAEVTLIGSVRRTTIRFIGRLRSVTFARCSATLSMVTPPVPRCSTITDGTAHKTPEPTTL
jgi:hypothetical protein